MSTLQREIEPSSPKPLVSVILPTYNRAAMVQEAIDSVLSQTYPEFELVVIDDGSTDFTPEVLSGYNNSIVAIRQSNKGVSSARNKGILKARGDLIALIDSDDYWLPEKMATQVAFFLRHPEIAICQTQEIWIRNGVRVNPKKRHRKRSGMIFEASLPLCLISPSAVMMRRSLLEQVGLFDESMPACEDYDLWLRVTAQYPVALIDTPLIVKRGGHADQLSRMPELDRYRIQAIEKVLRSGLLLPDQRSAAIRMLTTKCRIYAQGCIKRGKTSEAEYFASLPGSFEQK